MTTDKRFDQIESVLMDLMQYQDRATALFAKLFDGSESIVYGITREELKEIFREMRDMVTEIRGCTTSISERLSEIEQGLVEVQSGQRQALALLREMREEK